MYILDPEKREIIAQPLWYNPYLQIAYQDAPLTKEDINKQIQENFDRIEQQLQSGKRKVTTERMTTYTLLHTTISITTTTLSIQDLPNAFQ